VSGCHGEVEMLLFTYPGVHDKHAHAIFPGLHDSQRLWRALNGENFPSRGDTLPTYERRRTDRLGAMQRIALGRGWSISSTETMS
jgi:hypothetical protein